ncbi:MAG TPA: helix-turn-helix domain-containing protein [Acidobacteriaceae bacterium]|jgi:TetR/AcrR family transcriptional regulator, transcriptional repressor for nem operon|nr:helix-turn-helix domain-containing protein [Acidobacteriaceae bacterium]
MAHPYLSLAGTAAPEQGETMPYPSGHRTTVRATIVESARSLFNRHGFDNVSLDQIMSGAGLTRGGFYSYFRSKSDLYSEVLGCFFTDPDWKNRWEGVEVDLASNDVGPQVVHAYLSRQHFDDVENSCPMVALPTDVTRAGEPAKQAFETVFTAMVGVLEQSIAGDRRSRRTKAQAIAAMCVGGMVVARALANRDAADCLRDGCRAVALDLGGWKKKTHRRKSPR